jgi:hypothetical protein
MAVNDVAPRPHEFDGETIAEMMARESEDRRRPGRPAQVSPALIGLLRSNAGMDELRAETDEPEHRPGSVAAAVLFAMALGALFWAAVFFVVKLATRNFVSNMHSVIWRSPDGTY